MREIPTLFELIDKAKNLSNALAEVKKTNVCVCEGLYLALLLTEAPWACKKHLFQSMPAENRKSDRNTAFVAKFIRLAGENGDLESAKKVYKEVTNQDVNSLIGGYRYYCSMIYACGEVGDLKTAKEVLDDAKSVGMQDICYYSFIDAAGKNGDMKAAAWALDEAKSLQGNNYLPKHYLKFIEMAIKHGDWEAANRVFEEAKSTLPDPIRDFLNSISLETTDLYSFLENSDN